MDQGIFRRGLLSGAALALMTAASAYAQPQTAPAADDAETVEAVIVTGSRAVKDGSRAPTPVTVVSGEQLQKASPGQLGEAVTQLPGFRGSSRPSTGNVSATGPNSGSFLNLRNLGAQRTLVLIDGRRAAPSALSGATDINLLPQELVKRVDVVTGGASAAYGSDAVAGVVNFILDSEFTGVKGLVQGGVSTHGDARSEKATLSFGQDWADGRGHVLLSGSYFHTPGLQSLNDRDWSAQGWGTITDPANPTKLLIRSNLNSSLTSRGGVIVTSAAGTAAPANALSGIQFLSGGGVSAFNTGSLRSTLNQIGGDGARPLTNLSAAITTESLFGRVSYDLSSNLKVYAQGQYGASHNRYNQVQPFVIPGLNGVTIYSGNAYLPAAVQALMTQGGISSFTLGRVNFDFGPSVADARNRTSDLIAGLEADLGRGWSLSAYYEHGRNQQTIRTENNLILENFYAAADAVYDPSSQSIVCRVTLTNPGLYPGCTPLNLFGEGSPSQAAKDYVTGTSQYTAVLTQDVASFSLRGEPFSTKAGPIAVAFGGEYRREEADQSSDAISQQANDATGIRGFPIAYSYSVGGYQLTNVQPVSGSYEVKEAFLETQVPLVRDLPFARAIDLNGAVRLTDYSTSGSVTTWKAGLSWEPINDLRLRTTRSRDIRAPNVSELFSGSVQSLVTVRDTANGGVSTAVIGSAVGNKDLKPEIADTFTAGAVYKPSWLAGFTASIDYYSIDVADVIATLTAQQTVDLCVKGSSQSCSNIVRNTSGGIVRIFTPQLNLNGLKSQGVDVEASYGARLANGDTLAFRVMASRLAKMLYRYEGAGTVDRAGEVGLSSNPRWTATASVNWRHGPLELSAQERFVSAGAYDKTLVEGVTIEDNHIRAMAYTDLTATYDLSGGEHRGLKLFATVTNLFDKTPPIAPIGTLGTFYPTNAQLYDVIGRTVFAGVTFRY